MELGIFPIQLGFFLIHLGNFLIDLGNFPIVAGWKQLGFFLIVRYPRSGR